MKLQNSMLSEVDTDSKVIQPITFDIHNADLSTNYVEKMVKYSKGERKLQKRGNIKTSFQERTQRSR